MAKSKSTTKPIYAKEITGAANQVQGVYDANKAGLANISGELQGKIPGLLSKAFDTNPDLEAAQGYARDAIGGKYLNNNPYVEEMARQVRASTGDQVNSYFGKLGRVGSGAHMDSLGRGITEADMSARAQIYAQERAAQERAAFGMPGLTEAEYQGIPYALNATGAAAEIPYTGTRNLASGIGGLLGQYTKTKQKQGLGGLLLQSAGNIASAYAGGGF